MTRELLLFAVIIAHFRSIQLLLQLLSGAGWPHISSLFFKIHIIIFSRNPFLSTYPFTSTPPSPSSLRMKITQLIGSISVVIALHCAAVVNPVSAHSKVLCAGLKISSSGVYTCEQSQATKYTQALYPVMESDLQSTPVVLSADQKFTLPKEQFLISAVVSSKQTWSANFDFAPKPVPEERVARGKAGQDFTILWATNNHDRLFSCNYFWIDPLGPFSPSAAAPFTDLLKWQQPENLLGLASFGLSEQGKNADASPIKDGLSPTGTRCIDSSSPQVKGIQEIVRKSSEVISNPKVCYSTFKLPANMRTGQHRILFGWNFEKPQAGPGLWSSSSSSSLAG